MRIELTPDEHPGGWWRLRDVDDSKHATVDLPTFLVPPMFERGDEIVICRRGDYRAGMWVPDVALSLALPRVGR